jgi:hypothetical protein
VARTELPDGEGCTSHRTRRQYRRDTRAIRQTRIQQWLLVADVVGSWTSPSTRYSSCRVDGTGYRGRLPPRSSAREY